MWQPSICVIGEFLADKWQKRLPRPMTNAFKRNTPQNTLTGSARYMTYDT